MKPDLARNLHNVFRDNALVFHVLNFVILTSPMRIQSDIASIKMHNCIRNWVVARESRQIVASLWILLHSRHYCAFLWLGVLPALTHGDILNLLSPNDQ
jgi:hypothetical protein